MYGLILTSSPLRLVLGGALALLLNIYPGQERGWSIQLAHKQTGVIAETSSAITVVFRPFSQAVD